MPSQRNARTICTKQYGRASVVHAIVRQSSPSLTVPCAPPTSGPRRCRYCWGYSPRSRSRSHSHSPAVLHAGARCAAKSARGPGPHDPGRVRDSVAGPGRAPGPGLPRAPCPGGGADGHARAPASGDVSDYRRRRPCRRPVPRFPRSPSGLLRYGSRANADGASLRWPRTGGLVAWEGVVGTWSILWERPETPCAAFYAHEAPSGATSRTRLRDAGAADGTEAPVKAGVFGAHVLVGAHLATSPIPPWKDMKDTAN